MSQALFAGWFFRFLLSITIFVFYDQFTYICISFFTKINDKILKNPIFTSIMFIFYGKKLNDIYEIRWINLDSIYNFFLKILCNKSFTFHLACNIVDLICTFFFSVLVILTIKAIIKDVLMEKILSNIFKWKKHVYTNRWNR